MLAGSMFLAGVWAMLSVVYFYEKMRGLGVMALTISLLYLALAAYVG